MIVTKNKTLDVTKLSNNLLLIEGEIFFTFVNGDWVVCVGINDADFFAANTVTKIGYSNLFGIVYATGFEPTPTEPRFLLLEDGDFVLLEDDGKIQLQRS